MLKVSVVVATYAPGEGLDRLVRSLDSQTLPVEDFEIIFVDDGSPDDTFSRLEKIEQERSNVRIVQIENSGWPCRPRNIGTDMAVGEYVAYMDHDDLLFPDALRGAYEFARENAADVVSGKEARTHDAEWAIDTYVADVGNSKGRRDQHPLIPMNPHKLYRRDFLNEHGIRFREGGRVLWEDIFFNVKVSRHAAVVSTLSSVPYYHWYTTPGSGSTGFVKASEDWWFWLREVITAIDEDLGGAGLELERRQMLSHQYRARLLASFDGKFAERPEPVRDMIYAACRDLQETYFDLDVDAELNASQRIRATLLRADRRDLLERVPSVDPGIPGWARATDVTWQNGVLMITASARWVSGSGRTHALRRADGRIVKDLPDEYTEVLPADLLDVTTEIEGAVARLGLRSRASRVTWMAEAESEVRISDQPDGGVAFDVAMSGRIDPAVTIFGAPLEPGVWDVNARCTLGRVSQQQRMRADFEPVASTDGRSVMIAYANADGFLSLDIDQTVKKAPKVLLPVIGEASTTTAGGIMTVRVPLAGAEVRGDGRVATVVDIEPVTAPRRWSERLRGRKAETSPLRIHGQLDIGAFGVVLEFSLPEGWSDALISLGTERAQPLAPWRLSG